MTPNNNEVAAIFDRLLPLSSSDAPLTVTRCHLLLLCRYRLPVLREEHCNVLFGGDPFERVFKPVPDVNIVGLTGGEE